MQTSFFMRSDRKRWSLSIFAIAIISVFALSTGAASAQISASSISPTSGPLSGGNTIRIFGSGFDSSTSVWVYATQAKVVSVNSSEIDVTAPPKNSPSAVDVAVFGHGGVSRLLNGYRYVSGSAPSPSPSPAPPAPSPSPSPSPSPAPGTGTALSSCADITSGGSYYLTQDVSSGGTCFFIDADNISLNLNGHTINYASDGGSQPTPAILLADEWFTSYGIAQSGTTRHHGNLNIYGGSIIESTNGAPRSAAIWVGETDENSPSPKIHDLTLKTYTTDSSPIFGTFGGSGWQIYNNNIYYSSTTTSSRSQFFGQAIWLGDGGSSASTDLIYGNHIYAAPQGGIRDINPNAKIYNNDITFSALYSNDFCVDSPADGQEIYGNNCHPTSGRGFHTNSSNTYIHDNTIKVQELPQNSEYGGCELGGAYGVQVEYDPFRGAQPTGIRVASNTITASAGACTGIAVRVTDIAGAGSATFTNNVITTTNQGAAGLDYGLSFNNVVETGTNLQFSGNTFSSRHAYVTVDWDGASVTIPAGQIWNGSPQYSIDNENGFNDPSGPKFSQSITVYDSTPGTMHCGGNAGGYMREGSQSQQCNNLQGNPIP